MHQARTWNIIILRDIVVISMVIITVDFWGHKAKAHKYLTTEYPTLCEIFATRNSEHHRFPTDTFDEIMDKHDAGYDDD